MTHLIKHNQLNTIKYDISYVNINSATRDKNFTFESDKASKLEYNPLQFKFNYNLHATYTLRIYHPGHNFSIEDKITITGIPSRSIILRTKIDDPKNNPFHFVTGSNYLKIMFNGASDIDPDIFENTLDESNLFIKLHGFQGNSSSSNIGNIPISTLNKKHKVFLSIPNVPFDPNVIYIKLIRRFSDKNSEYIFNSSYNVTITYDYILGIPLNRLNSQYPIDNDHLQGFQSIINIEKDYYSINIYKTPGSFKKFGGGNICVSKMIAVNNGYNSPNQYSINLDKIYSNVVSMSLVSSEFPNTEHIIKEKINNAFYWENLDDGGSTYKIELKSGNYTACDLAKQLQEKVATVLRTNLFAPYSNKNYMKFPSIQQLSLIKKILKLNFRRSKQQRLQLTVYCYEQ